MKNKMLVKVLSSTFTLNLGRDPKNPIILFVPISTTSDRKNRRIRKFEFKSGKKNSLVSLIPNEPR